MTRVGIIGLGYVGLPLATAFAEAGLEVRGVDVSAERVAEVNAGRSYIGDVGTDQLAPLVASGRLTTSTDGASLRDCQAILICLPTPLDDHRVPDLSYVTAGGEMTAANLSPGTLVVLESSTYPGTTRELLQPILERDGRRVGEDLFLAFSPERIDPGNREFGVRDTPRVVGGITRECTRRAKELYEHIVEVVHVVSTPESAEMSKLLENTFRAVNIALVNELAILCDRMGIDVWETIRAASTKPFGFMPFWPGPGLGGHCIPVDPFYLTWRAKAFDLTTEFVELAGRINVNMPYYAVSRIARALNGQHKSVAGSRILLLGMSYKPNVGDMRESPSLKLLELLRAEGAEVLYHDPHVPDLVSHGLRSEPLDDDLLGSLDCVVIATNHRAVDLRPVVDRAALVVDLRNAVRQSLGGDGSGAAPDNVDVL
ncbi:MAG: nucleotide sugar dehydrogenase [Chloroflexi bacterium]|nr:nucleotide sugar dehydrogenase [Chloroflexota bacterium]MBA3851025.1 nucleotide sugar dehydrogenase [Chloroflexota bacterium]MDQ3406928.1 nucleotide sugar dehydrogenase [Chloroflexota bacterium]